MNLRQLVFCALAAGLGWLTTHTVDGAIIAAMVCAGVYFVTEVAATVIRDHLDRKGAK